MSPKVITQLCLMMFVQYFIWGVWYVTMGTYLGETLKFDGTAIGLAYTATGWGAIVSPILVGMIADRFFDGQKVLGFLHLLGAAFIYWASTVQDSTMFFIVLLLYAMCYMPTIALTNAVAFHQMTDTGKQFPPIRVLGTLGWIVAGIYISFKDWEASNIPLQLGAIASIIMGIYCFTLPSTPPKAAGQRVTLGSVLGADALSMLKDRSFLIFVVSSFLICIPLAFYYGFTNLFLNNIDVENAAFKQTFGQMSEVLFMIIMPFFFVRLGVKYMLLVGMLAWVARYFLFAYGIGVEWMLLLGIVLHGICYDFFFVTGQIYTDQKAPKAIQASAQGLIALVTYGLGMVIGTYFAGWIVKSYTTLTDEGVATYAWQSIWLVPAVMALAVTILFALVFRDNGKRSGDAVEEVEKGVAKMQEGELPE